MRGKKEEILFAGQQVQVTYKDIKNMYLRVTDTGEVKVSVPRSISRETILRFLESRREWIETKSAACRPAVQWRNGETFSLWGKDRLFYIEEAVSVEVIEDKDHVLCRMQDPGDGEKVKAIMERWCRRGLEKQVEELILPCETTTGRRASRWKLRSMRSRWGSCNVKTGDITLNTKLVEYPVECLHYVMIHELTHLIEPSHNRRFWEKMDVFYPKWRDVRRVLRR